MKVVTDWDRFEKAMEEEIAKADEWLKLCIRTRCVNKRIATSYGLKHIVEHWWEKKHKQPGYLGNGCFLMEGKPGNYCLGNGYSLDCFNAWINITTRGMPGEGTTDMTAHR